LRAVIYQVVRADSSIPRATAIAVETEELKTIGETVLD
jgi:hypothetical protein